MSDYSGSVADAAAEIYRRWVAGEEDAKVTRTYEDLILAEASAIQQRRTAAEFAEHQERVAK